MNSSFSAAAQPSRSPQASDSLDEELLTAPNWQTPAVDLSTGANVLLVDDNLVNLRVLSRLLDREGYKVRPVHSGDQALKAIEAHSPDLILLDIRMPGMDGYEVCERLKADARFRSIPIIFISAADALHDKIKGFEVGGVDYIAKPFQELEVLARINTHLQIYRLQQALNEKIVALEKANARITELSVRDELTKLYNRRYFNAQADRFFQHAQRYQQPLSFAIGDVDCFKGINDRFSHAIGDRVLQGVAQVLQKNLRSTDLCARYGGEEFVIALPGIQGQDAIDACNKVRRAIEAAPWPKIHPELSVTISIGVCADLTLDSYEAMLAIADRQLYCAKHGGRNRVCG